MGGSPLTPKTDSDYNGFPGTWRGAAAASACFGRTISRSDSRGQKRRRASAGAAGIVDAERAVWLGDERTELALRSRLEGNMQRFRPRRERWQFDAWWHRQDALRRICCPLLSQPGTKSGGAEPR